MERALNRSVERFTQPQAEALEQPRDACGSWRSLAREQVLDDAQAAELMCRLVTTAGRRSEGA